jgi:serine/threonine protein kinase
VVKENENKRRKVIIVFVQMRDIRHENLVPFLGACVENMNIFILTPYCSRGSLEDVLNNEGLDNMFVASLITDLLKARIGVLKRGRKHVPLAAVV